jgi:hypothetical protein
MIQSAILILSAAAFALLQSDRRAVQRAACIIGIVAQYFWISETLHARQWGMLVLAAFYGAVYARKLATLRSSRAARPTEYASYSRYRENLPK